MAKLLGETLLEDFMKPMGITVRQLAADIDLSPSYVSGLVNGVRTSHDYIRHNVQLLLRPRATRKFPIMSAKTSTSPNFAIGMLPMLMNGQVTVA